MADMDGVEAMRAEMQAIVGRVNAATPVGLSRALFFVEAKAKELLSLTSHLEGTPTPSAPGSPPSLISGNLRRSITVQGPVANGDDWVGSVGPTAVYGRIQELGGMAGMGAILPPRPYMAPAWAQLPARVHSIMETVWSDAVE